MPRGARNKLYHSSEAAKPAQSVPGKRGISNEAGRVKSVFSSFLPKLGHTSPSAHEVRLFLPLLFIGVTLICSARLRSSTQCCPPNISSITIDHDELCELPIPKGRRVT